MNELNYPQTTKYIIAHNGEDIFSFNTIEPQNCFSTGQPFMEIFDSKEEAKQAFPQAFPADTTELSPLCATQSYIDLISQTDTQI